MSERSCDGCTLCCKLFRVPETAKPEGAWCGDCVVGRGCGVHATRPRSCRNFSCFWLLDAGFPDDLRPDRCGVVVAFNDDDASVVMHVDPDDPEAYAREPATDWLQPLLNAYARVIVVCGEDRFMIERRAEAD